MWKQKKKDRNNIKNVILSYIVFFACKTFEITYPCIENHLRFRIRYKLSCVFRVEVNIVLKQGQITEHLEVGRKNRTKQNIFFKVCHASMQIAYINTCTPKLGWSWAVQTGSSPSTVQSHMATLCKHMANFTTCVTSIIVLLPLKLTQVLPLRL